MQILGSGMSAKMWEVTVEHARTCILTNQMHLYCPNGQRKRGVVFNIVGEVRSFLSGQQFVCVNDLSDSEKAEAQSLVKLAFEHWNDVITCSTGPIIGNSSHAPPFLPGSLALPDDMYSNFPSPIKVDGFGHTHLSVSSPDIFPIGCSRGFDAFPLQVVDCMEPPSLVSCNAYSDSRELERMSHPLMFEECGGRSLFSEDSLQYLDSDIPLLSQSLGTDTSADLGTAVTAFLATSARSAAARVKANTGWATLLSVLRWRFSIKRIIASKKNRVHEERFG